MINAKAETVTEKKTYAPLIKKPHHRALLVADGYYEWLRPEDPKQQSSTARGRARIVEWSLAPARDYVAIAVEVERIDDQRQVKLALPALRGTPVSVPNTPPAENAAGIVPRGRPASLVAVR